MLERKSISEERRQALRELARFLAVHGVRNNTDLEDLHAGAFPRSETGDFSDVKVVYPGGEIPWNELARVGEAEMRSLKLSVERALEVALLGYEALGEEERKILFGFMEMQRSYDRPDGGE
ncbi:MAG: hypothetical protein LBU47_03270 [Christensenellaceae bacterium]|jgi:hypothetical protein|nr:hypothetical protein [Christensenellaceae bacterium]